MSVKLNAVNQLYPGVYHATVKAVGPIALKSIDGFDRGYVLLLNQKLGTRSWENYENIPLLGSSVKIPILVKTYFADVAIESAKFLEAMNVLKNGHCIGCNELPPDYIEFGKFKDGALYRCLEKYGWRWELILNHNDYCEFLAPKEELVQRFIEKQGQAEDVRS